MWVSVLCDCHPKLDKIGFKKNLWITLLFQLIYQQLHPLVNFKKKTSAKVIGAGFYDT